MTLGATIALELMVVPFPGQNFRLISKKTVPLVSWFLRERSEKREKRKKRKKKEKEKEKKGNETKNQKKEKPTARRTKSLSQWL